MKNLDCLYSAFRLNFVTSLKARSHWTTATATAKLFSFLHEWVVWNPMGVFILGGVATATATASSWNGLGTHLWQQRQRQRCHHRMGLMGPNGECSHWGAATATAKLPLTPPSMNTRNGPVQNNFAVAVAVAQCERTFTDESFQSTFLH